ncbi:MAG: sigma-70 family RNA polymerase sigma factor [Gammaproteobacteria bacterium]
MFGNGRRKQFEKLFQPHLNAAYNLARYLCGNAFDAEDIVQEAYLRAYRAFANYNDENSRAWILTITRNTCYSWMRKYHMNIEMSFNEELDSTEIEGMPACSIPQSPEQLAESACCQRQVREAIKLLPIAFREVIILRELEGLSYREIAAVTGNPQGTVMSRLSRARQQLRQLLGDYQS